MPPESAKEAAHGLEARAGRGTHKRRGPGQALLHRAVGFNADHDHQVNPDLRFVQLTPPGSACSIALGTALTDAAPGSVTGLQLVVSDIEAARTHLADGGVQVSEVQDFPWGRFVFFADPDGNRWSVQQQLVRG